MTKNHPSGEPPHQDSARTAPPDVLIISAPQTAEQRAALIAEITRCANQRGQLVPGDDLFRPRPLSEWNEDMGDVLWWKFPITESPYVGSPLDLGHGIEVHAFRGLVASGNVGGWPGYHTHWTPLAPIARVADLLYRADLATTAEKQTQAEG